MRTNYFVMDEGEPRFELEKLFSAAHALRELSRGADFPYVNTEETRGDAALRLTAEAIEACRSFIKSVEEPSDAHKVTYWLMKSKGTSDISMHRRFRTLEDAEAFMGQPTMSAKNEDGKARWEEMYHRPVKVERYFRDELHAFESGTDGFSPHEEDAVHEQIGVDGMKETVNAAE